MSVWAERVVTPSGVLNRVRYRADGSGTIVSIESGADPRVDDLRIGTALPGNANAHSHAFHRALRGTTHSGGGDFWLWREKMYVLANRLTPDTHYRLTRAVFAEMLAAGFTAVGEFHYLHHRPDGTPYPAAMEEAILAAADDIGIRLTLLDTAYLAGGIGRRLSPAQRRFGDDDAESYLRRWHALRSRDSRVAAGIHSVRAVPPDAIAAIVAGLPPGVPLHIHVSEQTQEVADSLEHYGRTPVALLHDLGALTARTSVIHATHPTDADIALLGGAGVSVVMCPTTEADLGDGIGPARELADAGARIALGSDQNAVVDPFLETRGLEMHERLRSRRRGRFSPAEILTATSDAGYHSLGHPIGPLSIGGPLDLVEVDTRSVRTVGSEPRQLPLTATATDVTRVVVGGRVVAAAGSLTSGEDPAELLAEAMHGLVASR